MKPWEVVWADTGTGALDVGQRFRSLPAAKREAERREPGSKWSFDPLPRIDPTHPMVKEAGGRPVRLLREFCGFCFVVRASLARVP